MFFHAVAASRSIPPSRLVPPSLIPRARKPARAVAASGGEPAHGLNQVRVSSVARGVGAGRRPCTSNACHGIERRHVLPRSQFILTTTVFEVKSDPELAVDCRGSAQESIDPGFGVSASHFQKDGRSSRPPAHKVKSPAPVNRVEGTRFRGCPRIPGQHLPIEVCRQQAPPPPGSQPTRVITCLLREPALTSVLCRA